MSEMVFWILIIVIFYTYLGYPLLIGFLSLLFAHPVRKGNNEPMVTFLITAYNEEKNIGKKLENVLALDYPKEKIEIGVASDGSTDETDEIVRKFKDKMVRLIRVEGRMGKTETQNRAVKEARGEIIIFSDATTYYEKGAIRNIVQNYADPQVGAVSGRYRYIDPGTTQIGTGTIAFWDYENFIKMKQTQIRTITGCCGCIYSVRRSLYEPLPADIISDLVEPLKILKKGYRIVFEPEALAYETVCEKSKEEFRMRVRVITRGMRGLLYMRNLLNPFRYPYISFQLVSHKVLRWFIPVFVLGLYLSNVFLLNAHIFFLIFFILQSLFYLAALIGFIIERSTRRKTIFALPLYFCVVNYASLAALIRVIMGRKDIVWSTKR